MLSAIFLKLAGFVLLSSVVGTATVIQLDLYNKNQYKEIYLYGYVDSVTRTSPVGPAAAPAAVQPVAPVPVPEAPQQASVAAVNEPVVPTNIEKTQCKISNKNTLYVCALQKPKFSFSNNQIGVTEIMNATQEGVVSLVKDDIVQIEIPGESTEFQNTSQDIYVEYQDHENNKHEAKITVLFSTSTNGVKILSQSSTFVGTPVQFGENNTPLSKNTSYTCSFTKGGTYQNCKVYDFASNNGKNYKTLSFTKPTNKSSESSKIEKDKNYLIEFINKEFSNNDKTLFIKSNNIVAEMQYAQGIYDGSADKIIILPQG